MVLVCDFFEVGGLGVVDGAEPRLGVVVDILDMHTPDTPASDDGDGGHGVVYGVQFLAGFDFQRGVLVVLIIVVILLYVKDCGCLGSLGELWEEERCQERSG